MQALFFKKYEVSQSFENPLENPIGGQTVLLAKGEARDDSSKHSARAYHGSLEAGEPVARRENPTVRTFSHRCQPAQLQSLTSVKNVAAIKPMVLFGREEIENCARLSTRCA
jgi:hypothetical protein